MAPWFGGKHRIAGWICEFFPAHDIYLEPFCGMASVFMRKVPARHEVINDKSGDVVNLFRCIREHPESLRQALELTVYSRDEFKLAFKVCPADPVEKARRFIVRLSMGMGADEYSRSFNHSIHQSKSQAKIWETYPPNIEIFCRRLKNAVIENQDALETIEKFADIPNALIYVDPPYLLKTRKSSRRRYQHEYDESDHAALVEALADAKAMVAISAYDDPIYNDLGWRRHQKQVSTMFGTAVESLYLNAALVAAKGQMTLGQ